jgi:hypothetical protein
MRLSLRWLAAVALLMFFPMVAQAADPALLASGDVLRGRFVQERQLKGFKAPLKSEGSFLLAPGAGLIWRVEKPFAVLTILTAQGLAQETNGGRTLSLPAAKLPFIARLSDMLGGALSGNWDALAGDFAVTRSGTPEDWRVALAPKRTDDPMFPYRGIEIEGGSFVGQVTLIKTDGDSERLSFTDQSRSTTGLSPDESALLAGVAP